MPTNSIDNKIDQVRGSRVLRTQEHILHVEFGDEGKPFSDFRDAHYAGNTRHFNDSPFNDFIDFPKASRTALQHDRRFSRTLVVLQPTPFCNLDCTYCYLPDREMRHVMEKSTVIGIAQELAETPWLGREVTILWHGGEPLTAPMQFFADAIETFSEVLPNHRIIHNIQTNATRVTASWAEFLWRHRVSVGVSIDGPPDIHDRRRRRKGGQSSCVATVRGIETLKYHGVVPSIIGVLTVDSVRSPERLMDFYQQLGVRSVAFNVEEIEGAHRDSSMAIADARTAVYEFYRRLLRWLIRNPEPTIRIREVTQVCSRLLSGNLAVENHNNLPLRILTFDYAGRYSTFSPELLAFRTSSNSGEFVLGTIGDGRLQELPSRSDFVRIARDVARGVKLCATGCDYFGFCGGGAPSNKFAEHGTFASTDTMACRLGKMAPTDAVLDHLLERPYDLEWFYG